MRARNYGKQSIASKVKDTLARITHFYSSSYFLNNALKKRYGKEIIKKFDESSYTEEVVHDNFDYLVELIDSEEFAFSGNYGCFLLLFKSPVILREALNNKNLDLICKLFPEMTEENIVLLDKFVADNLELVKSYFDYDPNDFFVSFKRKSFGVFVYSHVLFNVYFKQGNFKILSNFDESLFTESFIKNNLDIIMSNIEKISLSKFKKSQIIFNEYLKQKRFDLLIDFDKSLFTDECLKKNAKEIIENISYCHGDWSRKSSILLDECARQKRSDLLWQFSESLFTEEFILNNYDFIISCIEDRIPYFLLNSKALFNGCAKNNKFNLLLQFDESFFTDEFIQDNLDMIIENLNNFNDGLPKCFKKSQILFNELLSRKLDSLLIQMDISFFTHDVVKNNYAYFSSLFKSDIRYCILLNNDKINFKELVLEHKDYDMLLVLSFDEDLLIQQNGKIIFNQSKLKFYSDLIGISETEFVNKIKDLLKINDEILNTMYPFMLSKKMNYLSFKNIEKLSLYSDIQLKLAYFKDNDLMILNRILKYLDEDLDNSYDVSAVIYYMINSWHYHEELLKTVDINKLTQEQLNNLIFVLQRKNDFYRIKTVEDLERDNFNRLNEELFKEIEDRVLNGNITIEELKRAILEKKYCLDLKRAQFINKRYCQDMDIVNESSGISKRNRIILQSINYILKINNMEELSFIYLTATRFIDDYSSFIDLEAQIRQDYARRLSESLYKIKEEHLMKREDFAKESLFKKVSNIAYKGKKPKFYVMDGDFNLQIHVLGAYRDWERPDDFKEDWERPKIAYHGICTSYIANNQIANARQYHPAYGFDSYEAEALLAMQDSDIFSDGLISQFASSIYQPCSFYPSKEMIDKTRHSHNECVLERRSGKNGTSFKRLPNYVVYIVDDINKESNFSMIMNPLFNETVQAAVDNDIPIVIVDRLKYAKSEKQKYEALLEKFEQQPNTQDMKDILLIVCNNMVGCAKYELQLPMAYHTYFNQKVLEKVIDKIIEIIDNQPENSRKELITELYKISLKEPLIIGKKKAEIYELYRNLNLNVSCDLSDEDRPDILREVREYFDTASKEVRDAIIIDLNSGLSYEDVYDNISNNRYGTMRKN